MTPVQEVYDAFFVKILDDEYGAWNKEEIQQDLSGLLNGALPRFKFPRTSLKIVNTNDDVFFEGDLGVQEIQILATYMKCEWLNRSILTWENIKPEYVERDFSKANLIDKLNNTLTEEQKEARRLEAIYYRSVDGKPFNFSKLAGGD